MSDSKLLSLDEVCKILEKPEVTIKRLAREHLLNSVKEGNELKFPEEDVMKFKEIAGRL